MISIHKIPIRGCLSYGDLKVEGEDKTKIGTIVYGGALVDAYKNEQKQNWLGIVISPRILQEESFYELLKESTLDKFARGNIPIPEVSVPPSIGTKDLHFYLLKYAVPIKNERSAQFSEGYNTLAAFAIIPNNVFEIADEGKKNIKTNLRNNLRALTHLHYLSDSESSQSKYRSTIEFIKSVVFLIFGNDFNEVVLRV